MIKRDFFKLISGLLGSSALPITETAPTFQPFADLHNKCYSTYEDAFSAMWTAEIDREMILLMLKIAIDVGDPQKMDLESHQRYVDNSEILRNLEFKIEPFVSGYKIVVNEYKTNC